MNPRFADLVRLSVGEAPCVVALGGGADSSVLLAAAVAALGHGRVRGVFVYHALEGSDDLRKAVETLADHLGVECAVVEAVLLDGPDLEARARNARYAALSGALVDHEICCTAHTHDDQAETVLMRLMRGSGATGMSGIPSVRGSFVRPFLEITRADLRAAAEVYLLPFVDDPANDDPRFLRSRIRTELIPEIEGNYASAFRDNLVRTARLSAMDDAVLIAQSAVIPTRSAPGEVAIPTAPLLTAPPALSHRAVRRALGQFHAPYHGSHEDVAAVIATATDGKPRTLTGDIACLRENAEVVLVVKQAIAPPEPVPVVVGEPFRWQSRGYTTGTSMEPSLRTTTGRRTAVRMPIADEEMAIRGLDDGDKIDIDGGSTAATEVLRAAGVPARLRPLWTVVTIDAKIAALHGVKVAPWARPIGGEPAVIIEGDDEA
jgi:tRNA(Ile)-lysidine synthase